MGCTADGVCPATWSNESRDWDLEDPHGEDLDTVREIRDTVEERVVDMFDEALEHSRGLGLWFVNWAVTRLGDSVSFEASTTGTAVVVKIPDLRMSGTDSESGPSVESALT